MEWRHLTTEDAFIANACFQYRNVVDFQLKLNYIRWIFCLNEGVFTVVHLIACRTLTQDLSKIAISTPWNFVQGGSNSKNDPGVWLWYSYSTRRAEHAHIGGTSQRVANSGVRALWSWKFWKKKIVFSHNWGVLEHRSRA